MNAVVLLHGLKSASLDVIGLRYCVFLLCPDGVHRRVHSAVVEIRRVLAAGTVPLRTEARGNADADAIRGLMSVQSSSDIHLPPRPSTLPLFKPPIRVHFRLLSLYTTQSWQVNNYGTTDRPS